MKLQFWAGKVALLIGVYGSACTMDEHVRHSSNSEDGSVPEVMVVPPSEGSSETTLADDVDPDPHTVEVWLEATPAEVELAPGRKVALWTYNGVFPGPRIEAAVGDTVRVHLKNSLPTETTIHWHGVRVPAAMDGAPAVQNPVSPNSEFTYEFVVPDAGTFWYHPHVRSDEQVERGLYGALVVHGPQEPTTTTDRVVILDDLLIEDDWSLKPFDTSYAMPGRQGNLIVANGRAHPILPMSGEGLHRLRFINAANARYFRLALPGQQFYQIATDGGLFEKPVLRDEILIVPGERVEIVVQPNSTLGETREWRTLRYDRGHGTGDLPDAVVFQERTETLETSQLEPTQSFNPIEVLSEASVFRDVELSESDHAGHHGGSSAMMDVPMFMINGKMHPDMESFNARLGETEEWKIVNTAEMDHPFHIHGFRFQIVDEEAKAPEFIAWRDTINIPAKASVTIRMKLEDHPGTWMFHCHILEHAELGMMGELIVVE